MNKQIYIGVAGVARSGKNLFCDLLVKQLKSKYNLHAKHFALATELKEDCRQFIRDKFNLDVFTDKTEEKSIFRDMLVWYGDAKRKQSEGRYWINKLNLTIEKEFAWGTPPIDVAIVSDIRYDFYPNDEVNWIQREKNGILIHVGKFTYGFPSNGRIIKVKGNNGIKIFTDPANSHEMLNDPKLREKADYLIQWEDVSDGKSIQYEDLLQNEYLNSVVSNCIESDKLKKVLSC